MIDSQMIAHHAGLCAQGMRVVPRCLSVERPQAHYNPRMTTYPIPSETADKPPIRNELFCSTCAAASISVELARVQSVLKSLGGTGALLVQLFQQTTNRSMSVPRPRF
jgi:hypothetical protein